MSLLAAICLLLFRQVGPLSTRSLNRTANLESTHCKEKIYNIADSAMTDSVASPTRGRKGGKKGQDFSKSSKKKSKIVTKTKTVGSMEEKAVAVDGKVLKRKQKPTVTCRNPKLSRTRSDQESDKMTKKKKKKNKKTVTSSIKDKVLKKKHDCDADKVTSTERREEKNEMKVKRKSASTRVREESITSTGTNITTATGDDSYYTDSNSLNRVSFSVVEVKEYAYTLGNGVTQNGPPVTISSHPIRSQRHDLESYEQVRSLDRRKYEELILSVDQRTELLRMTGFSDKEITMAALEAAKIRHYRNTSVANMHWDGWTEKAESLGRKVTKWTIPLSFFRRTATKGGPWQK